ncbi:MAG: OsmC family protein [Terriglobia bacterium]
MLNGKLRLATVQGNQNQFVAMSGGGHSFVVDTGDGNTGTRPAELALLAVGSCTAMDIISILRKKRQAVTGYEVEIRAEQREEYPQTFTKVTIKHRLRGKIDPEAVQRAIELSETKYCSVGAMIAKSAKIEATFEIVEDEPGK